MKKWVAFAMKIKKMGIYFINDPDGNWMEVIPKGRF